MNLKISDLDIYKGEGELFLSNGDHYLLRISGEDSLILESILLEFREPTHVQKAFDNLKSKIDNDQFNNLVNWLIQNGILYQDGTIPVENIQKTKNGIVWGDFENEDELQEKIFNRLCSENIEYSLKSLIYNDFEEATFENCDYVMVFSPIFSNYSAFQKLNEICYKLKIPMFHVGTGMNFITVGPFSVPSRHTPCLKCYSKRKMINFDSKSKYLKFIQLNDQKIIGNSNLFKNHYFGMMVEFLKVELENYFIRNSMYLYARSITMDFLNYDISESKVLRIPYCEVCDKTSVVSPLN